MIENEGNVIVMRNEPNNPIIPELDRWLCRATKDLIPPACEAIRAEIVPHFEDAVAETRAAGASENEAIDRALRDLGSPRRANRLYRRHYLTKSEWRRISETLDRIPGNAGRRLYRILFVSGLIVLAGLVGLALAPIWMNAPPSWNLLVGLFAPLGIIAFFFTFLGIRAYLAERSPDGAMLFGSLSRILGETGMWIVYLYILDRLDTVGWHDSLAPVAHYLVLAAALFLITLLYIGCEVRRTWRPWMKYKRACQRGEIDISAASPSD
jgi:hypothetical protein